MPRMEIELTSAQPDGSWTWRAAGARQPKGSLEGSLLYEGAKVGDTMRAEADFTMDGVTITAVLAPKAPRREPERLAILPKPEGPPVMAPDLDGPREGRGRSARSPSRERSGPRSEFDARDRGPRRDDRGGAGGRPPRTTTPGRRDGADRGRRPEGADDARGRGPSSGPRPDRRDRPDRSRGFERAPSRPAAPAQPRARRLQPGRAHRDAALANLPAEQRPIAEQLLRGGIPALRQALAEQNQRARSAGESEVKADALVALGETLLPALRAAEWRDRAEAVDTDVDTVSLRDLRAVVAGAEVAGRDPDSRALAGRLREALERRRQEALDGWLAEINDALREGRVVRALRVSSRPPDPGARFPGALGVTLAEAASEAMKADTTTDRWRAVLDAALASPVARQIQPRGIPAGAEKELAGELSRAAGRIPALSAWVAAPSARPPRPPKPPAPPTTGPGPSPSEETAGPLPVPADEPPAGADEGPPVTAAEEQPEPAVEEETESASDERAAVDETVVDAASGTDEATAAPTSV